MEVKVPEKAKLLKILKDAGFSVPDFIYLSARDFETENFEKLESFLQNVGDYKILVRSAHPLESFYRAGTFDSLETNADVLGVQYARKRIITQAQTAKRLHILRQQKFNHSPPLDLEEMGVVVMPFIEGTKIMAKKFGEHWEFGYTNESAKIRCESYITETPHDMRLLDLSEEIQHRLSFSCEIEYIRSELGDIYVVQAKDISGVELLDIRESRQPIKLDGLRRIRKRRNYRERVIYVMDNSAFYLNIISRCEDLVHDFGEEAESVADVLQVITDYEKEMETFALTHPCFAVLGLSVKIPPELFQIANHYLDEFPDWQKELSQALYRNQYQIEYFLAEADTVLAKDSIQLNICTHDAYGIDTVRNPLWFVYWKYERQEALVKEFKRQGYKTGDTVAITVDLEENPTIYRL